MARWAGKGLWQFHMPGRLGPKTWGQQCLARNRGGAWAQAVKGTGPLGGLDLGQQQMLRVE